MTSIIKQEVESMKSLDNTIYWLIAFMLVAIIYKMSMG